MNLPSDCGDIVNTTRMKGPSYTLKGDDLLDFTIFKDYDSLSSVKTIRPCKTPGDHKV